MANIGSMYATLGIKLQNIQATQQTMLKTLQNISREADKTKAKLSGLGKEMETTTKKVNKIKPEPIVPIVDTAPAMTSLNKYTTHLFQSAQRWRTFGYLTSIVLTAPLVAAGKAAIDTAGDFNYAMAKITGLAGIPVDNVKKLKEEIKSLAVETAQTPQALAEAAYFSASAGFKDSAQVMQIVETAAKMATAGMGTAADNAKVLVYSMNAYRKSGLTAAQAADIFTAAVREGAIETDEFATAVQQVLPISSAMGVSLDQVTGSMAAMSLQGASAQNAAVYLKGMLNALLKIKPGNAAGKALKEFGITADDLYKQLSQPGGLLKVLVRLQGLSKQTTGNPFLKEIFKDIRAMTGALSLTGENLEYNAYVMEQAAKAGGSLNIAYDAVQEQINIVKARIKALTDVMKAEFGETLANYILPLLEGFITHMRNLIVWFNNTSEGFKKFTTILGGITIALGPIALLGSTLKYIYAGTILAIGKNFIWLRNIIKGVNGDMIAMGNAAAAKKGLTTFVKNISSKALNAGGWALFAKNIGKALTAFGRVAGPVALATTAVTVGAVKLIKYAKEIKNTAEKNDAWNKTILEVNGSLTKMNELLGADIENMTVDELVANREKLNKAIEEEGQLLLQLESNKSMAFQSDRKNDKLYEKHYKHMMEMSKVYDQMGVQIENVADAFINQRIAQQKLQSDQEAEKVRKYNAELVEAFNNIKHEIAAIDEKAKALQGIKAFDVVKEKVDVLLKGMETLMGTEFKLKADSPQIKQLVLWLRELNYDFTETGKKSREFVQDLNSSLGSINLKKSLLGNMYDADAATFELYKKAFEEYTDILTSVDPVTGIILTPTQEQIDMLNRLMNLTKKYGEIVEDNTDKKTLNLLQAEADAFGNISGKVEVLNYALEAQRRLLRDMFKKQMTGEFIPIEDIQRAVRNIQALEGALVDYQNAESLAYLEDLNKSFHWGATGADLLSGRISALENKLEYLSKLGPVGEEMFKLTAKQLEGLKFTQQGLGILENSFDSLIDAMVDGTEDWGEVFKNIMSDMTKELIKFLAKAFIYQAFVRDSIADTTELGKVLKLSLGDVLAQIFKKKTTGGDITENLGFGVKSISEFMNSTAKQGPDLSQYLPPTETLDQVISKYGTLNQVTSQYGKIQAGVVGIERMKTAATMTGTAAEKASTIAIQANTVANSANAAASTSEAVADSAGAVASATKQGAKMPFPMNLVAIGVAVAAVMGALALMSRARNQAKAAKMAEGGIVPEGFPNDTYPALLSSGETVIPKKFINNQFRIEKDEDERLVKFEIEGETLVGILKKKAKKSSIY
jgi:TP901 family phage tail tape measure protein